jgi:hypothetical protein
MRGLLSPCGLRLRRTRNILTSTFERVSEQMLQLPLLML